MSKLKKQSIQDTQYLTDETGHEVLHVETPHALIQACGYIKHVAEPYERVLFRGQRTLYQNLCPSLYRGITSENSQAKRHAKINSTVEQFKAMAGIFSNIPDYAHEPLLQHYGIQTTWIDVVDNIWVALWFAIYRAHTVGRNSEFLHFAQRSKTVEKKYGYILLLSTDENRRIHPQKGLVTGSVTELVDLRIAAPSIFLRPHAQHGLLFRFKATRGGRKLDYAPSIKGIIRFELESGIDWLGNGSMHSIRSLFPPPYYDKGYRLLLECDLKDKSIGCINHVGA